MGLDSMNFSSIESNINNTTSIVAFFVITIVFTIIKFITSTKVKIPWTIAYLLIIIVVQYFITMSLTDKLCGESDPGLALKATLIPWLLVFGIINILLFVFPGWLRPFSNTIGYLFVKFTGGEEIIDELFTSGKDDEKVKEIISKIIENKMLVINEITEVNFDNFIQTMVEGGVINVDVDDYQVKIETLKDMIYKKNIIAESVWYMLTGILVIAIVNNYLINSGCQISVKAQKDKQAAFQKEAEETDYGTKTGQCLA
jgi:hypothetical protein